MTPADIAHLPIGRPETELCVHSINSRIIDAPTTRRHKLSNTEIQHQSYVHVTVRLENGIIGHGEAATLGGPRWAEESVEAIKGNIDTYLAPALIGLKATQLEAAGIALDKAAKRNFAAKGALQTALLDAAGKSLNLSAAELLGGRVRDRISVIWALASGDAEQEVAEAKAKIAAGQFNRFKIKLGFTPPEQDLKRLRHLRDGLAGAELIVDVNQGWSEADCIRWFPALEELDIALIEQPLPAGQEASMARLARRSNIPLMLDEGCFTADQTLAAAVAGAGSVLSLKLVKSGGPLALKRTAAIAEAAGLQLYGGCLLESGLGAAAHLPVFASLPSLAWGTEHFGPQILRQDLLAEPLVYRDFHLEIPDGPGLGVRPDPDKIAAFSRKDV